MNPVWMDAVGYVYVYISVPSILKKITMNGFFLVVIGMEND